MDLYSRRVVGWSMKPFLNREIVLDALLMALWRRRPKKKVLVHSDQGSQYSSDDWLRFCKTHGLEPSMSRVGNCWDNAVAESFFVVGKRSESKNAFTKHAIWPRKISSITSMRFTTEPEGIPISVGSAQRSFEQPQN